MAHSSLKGRLQDILRRAGIYNRVKASWVYDFYWRLADRCVVDDRRQEVKFYCNVLQGFKKGDLIFDVGANVGYKADIFLRLGARVLAIEPDDSCQEILREKFVKYRLKRKPIEIIGKALSDKSSIATMWVDTPGSAKNTLSQKWVETLQEDDERFGQRLGFGNRKEVETTTVEELIASHGMPFYVKIDVEGFEINVLKGMRRPVPYLSFEVNLPDFRSEGQDCVQALGRLASEGKFNYSVDCRLGLRLEQWVGEKEFLGMLASCCDASIEVFWRSDSLASVQTWGQHNLQTRSKN